MNKYTIYCTPEQTEKALCLGAPIECKVNKSTGSFCNINPTAEQMLGWIESNTPIVQILLDGMEGIWGYRIYRVTTSDVLEADCYSSRQEATLAAIDAALEYLENLKQ